ncbi:MAG: 16S rRNA (cytidine(1402)-2'-O)-methyltransferase, partial [Eggerthellaceae bacterium]|nr:16S rRNA (cytidine(1402)-2'-O)-methyltransferase [Eggerthellaceae bacterium]
MKSATSQGKLIICPTPIGNLGDITMRALEALRSADSVCAEDTRVTGKLLAAYDISKRLERLDEASIAAKASSIVERVLAGEVIAFCSDAGMPGVSDPGARLIEAARKEGACIEVLPGASAAVTAYVASGCANTHYYFGGFFPRKANEQRALVDSLTNLDAALVFYESPNRLSKSLAFLAEAFPYRELAVCRELTKMHEEIMRGTTLEVAEEYSRRAVEGSIKGEIVVVIDGPNEREMQEKAHAACLDASARARELLASGHSKKDVAKAIASDFGIGRNEAYDIV